MIEKTLVLLGLKEKEVGVYLEVMRLGKTTPAQVASSTGINRATVYSVCKLLLKKGLIQEDLGSGSRKLIALPPKELDVLVEKDRHRIKRKEELVDRAVAELEAMPLNTQYSIPQIRFVEEEELLSTFMDRAKIWDESILKVDETKTWWGFQDHTYAAIFKEWIERYWPQAHPDIQLKLLSNSAPIETEMKKNKFERRQIKFMDDNANFTATTWVLGEYLIMVYTNQKPYYAIEIFNPVMAHNYRELFKTIWPKY